MARAEAARRQSTRAEEETRRAHVWGENSVDVVGTNDSGTSNDTAAVPPCISSLCLKGESGSVTRGNSGAACTIQTAYRGGAARREASFRRLERCRKNKEANDRARKKVRITGREGVTSSFSPFQVIQRTCRQATI